MKVFWSWQSDTPGKIGRHVVRNALTKAIEELKESPDIQDREAIPPELHLDHDRQGAPGSPDLARLILSKIEQSAVFVADVTSVGAVLLAEPENQPKKLINSNVAIELGYALHAIGDSSILMVMNDHYGNRSDLPFDLHTKAGPITFSLAPNADGRTIAAVEASLKGSLKVALRLCLSEHREPALPPPPVFEGKTPLDGQGRFRSHGAPLGKSMAIYPLEPDPNIEVVMKDGPCFWFRLFSASNPKREWTFRQLDVAAGQSWIHLRTMQGFGDVRLSAPDGIGRCLAFNSQIAESASFLFRSGELWSIDATLVGSVGDKRTVYVSEIRKNLGQLIVSSSQILKSLGLDGPFRWIVGVEGIEGYRLAWDSLVGQSFATPTLKTPKVVVGDLYSFGEDTAPIIEAFTDKAFEECGEEPPVGLI